MFRTMLNQQTGWVKGFALVALAVMGLALLSACSVNPSTLSTSVGGTNVNNPAINAHTFSFPLVASPGIKACLPNAKGLGTITPLEQNDEMRITVSGLAPKAGYDLFVIELPNKPFGVSWYQSDLETDKYGNGSVTVRGIFNKETFSVSPGGPSTTFAPTHQFHVGLWFNDPKVPFDLGCEPGQTSPIVTPFNGEQHAGIQVLNTSTFPDNAGPLSHVDA